MLTILQDLRFGARMLLKKPGFTSIAVLTLALGIGANLTIFSFVDTFFYKPLPLPDADRLVTVEATKRGRWVEGYAYAPYAYFHDHSKSFETLAAHYPTAPLDVVANGDSWMANGAVVSANYFSALGARPIFGRFFLPEEDSVPDRDAVAVIGFGVWQHRFGTDPAILGKELRINGTAFKIVGVTPEDFRGARAGVANDLWIPTMMLRVGYRHCDALKDLNCRPLAIFGRLASGQTAAEAQAELSLLASQFADSFPEDKERQVALVPIAGLRRDPNTAILSYQMELLMGVTGLLLLIACANVAALQLVRGTARRRELIIRLCLGASRARLIRQLMTESMLQALAGGGLGLVISFWSRELLLVFYTTTYGRHQPSYDLSLNPRVIAYLCGLTLVTGLLFGLAPALQATRESLARALNQESRAQSSRHNRLRSALVAGQVALSLALLVAAGLLVRSSAQVRRGGNFDPQHVAALRLRPGLLKYSPAQAQAMTSEVVRRLEALPGVQSVSLTKDPGGLAWQDKGSVRVRLPEHAAAHPEDEPTARYHEIAPHFFETLKVPLIQGRDFNDGDRQGSPAVAIVNATLARRMWPDDSPLERALIVEDKPFQVVGVFKDSGLRNALEAPLPFLYVPARQNNFGQHVDSRLIVRVVGDPWEMLPLLRREVKAVDRDVPISEDVPLAQQVEAVYKDVLLTSAVLVSTGVLALFLSMIGLYSVLAFTVSQRTREIGIRMALGAEQHDVLKLVLGQGMTLVLVGVALGLVAAGALTSVMSSLLYGVSATDPATFVVVALLLVVVALLACYLPARRATKVDPMIALRYE